MTEVTFQAPEYQADGSFRKTQYRFKGDEHTGWKVFRERKLSLELGKGYALVETICCGICSTDLARRFLPYPLPQITGHEVVGRFKENTVVVEINSSHLARGFLETDCPFCKNGMHTQCPERITLGINQLPGGFSPCFLAPVKSITTVPDTISLNAASLTEPFAAALQGVEATYPRNNDSVAVLGPRRLGMLVIAALCCFRKQEGIDFKITGIIRHSGLEEQCRMLGADHVINLSYTSEQKLHQQYDIVFDTTGKPEGFESALRLSRRVVHLKSTNGQEVSGLKHLTDMVVDEITLLPFNKENLHYSWPLEKQSRKNRNILVSSSVSEELKNQAKSFHPEAVFHHMDLLEAAQQVRTEPGFLEDSPFPRFDLAIVSNLKEIDQALRPFTGEEFSPVRARGAILFASTENAPYGAVLTEAIKERQISIHTSRCGNFGRALTMFVNNPDIVQYMENNLITHKYNLEQIQKAFLVASDSKKSIKVVVEVKSPRSVPDYLSE